MEHRRAIATCEFVRVSANVPRLLLCRQGGSRQPEQPAWYRKSRDVLLQAEAISRAREKAYDDIQRAERGAPSIRAANPQLYLMLANTDMHLGDFQGAVDALRYATGLNPRILDAYDGLNVAYSALGNFPMAIANLEEKALVDNFPARYAECHP